VSERKGQDDLALRLARLPPGRHGLPRDFVVRNQRDRLAAGIIAVVAARGLNDATIAEVCTAAGVSRRTFYAYFSSKEDCYLSTYGRIVEYVRGAADEAAADADDWPGRVAAKLSTPLKLFAANPDLARFSLVAPQRAGGRVTVRYRQLMSQAVEYLCEGMPPPPATRQPSEAVAASLVGGMVALVDRKLDEGRAGELPQLLPDLLELFLTPYLGRVAAVAAAGATR
jgi:AcrR family transcriptional regulator